MLAELETPQEEEYTLDPKPDTDVKRFTVRGILFNVFWFAMLAMGLVIAGWPDAKIHLDPILSHLPSITPKHLWKDEGVKWLWLGISGIQIVWCIFHSKRLQSVFTTKLALYFGDISYSLYIVHFHLTLAFSPYIHRWANNLFGDLRQHHTTQILAIAYELSILLFVSVWQAHFYMKLVDKPCVEFSKLIERKARLA